jgi:carbonyl reductase 1
MVVNPKVFVVTGSNRGIGYATVKILAETTKGAVIYMTSRDLVFGEKMLKKLRMEMGDKQKSEVRLVQLDITDEQSCQNLFDLLKEAHPAIDVLINNAGFAFNNSDPTPLDLQAEITLGINYHGTKRISDKLIPLLRTGGRIINICSQAGVMRGSFNEEYVGMVSNQITTYEDIDTLCEMYKNACKTGNIQGFPPKAYSVSKALEIALTAVQSRELKPRKIIAVSVCPGVVATKMTGYKGIISPERNVTYHFYNFHLGAADTAVFLSSAPPMTILSGKLYYMRKPIEWP